MSEQQRLSGNVERIVESLRRQAEQLQAAIAATDGGYCDFFVENGGDGKPFHEKCPDDLVGLRLGDPEFGGELRRQVEAERQRLSEADGGYCDFFVENGGDGKPFHEKCSSLGPLDEIAASP